MADFSKMDHPRWMPVQGQTVWAYEESEEELTSAMWDEGDPYLVRLWERGQVFASHAEAMAAQGKGQPRSVTDFSKMRISELLEFAEAQARIEEAYPPASDPDRDASWAETLALLRLMEERGVPDPLQDGVEGPPS